MLIQIIKNLILILVILTFANLSYALDCNGLDGRNATWMSRWIFVSGPHTDNDGSTYNLVKSPEYEHGKCDEPDSKSFCETKSGSIEITFAKEKRGIYFTFDTKKEPLTTINLTKNCTPKGEGND